VSKIGFDTVVSRGTEHVQTQIGAQTVMMNISRGKYFAVGSTGQRIWDCIAEPASIGQIVDQLVDEYDVQRDQCAEEVMAFVATLIENGLTVEHAA
jgi:hypothetical protein